MVGPGVCVNFWLSIRICNDILWFNLLLTSAHNNYDMHVYSYQKFGGLVNGQKNRQILLHLRVAHGRSGEAWRLTAACRTYLDMIYAPLNPTHSAPN